MSGAVFSCQSSRPRTKRQARLLMIVGSESEVLIDLDTDNRSEVLFEGEAQHRPVIRGTGFDGRSLIVEGRSRPFGEAGANLVCLDCSSRRTLWGVQISKMSLVDVRWKPGEPYLGFLAWNTEMRVAVIGRMLAQCSPKGEPELIPLVPSVFGRGRAIGVHGGVVIYANKRSIRIWEPGKSTHSEWMQGYDISINAAGSLVSVLNRDRSISIRKWPSGDVVNKIVGEFADAGEWHPDGNALLVCDTGPVLGARGVVERIRLYDLPSRKMGWSMLHRRFVGAHGLRWVSCADSVFKEMSDRHLVASFRNACG
jgi:hypothetical protein